MMSLVCVPALAACIIPARRGNQAARLVWPSLLIYLGYSFLVAFNELFLVYVAIFGMSLFAFILALSGLDPELVKHHVTSQFPRRGIAIFLAVTGFFLVLAWTGRILPAQIAGQLPVGLASGTTLGIQAIDLALIVPTALITAVLLWRGRPWGYTLAAVLALKCLTMGAALVAMIIGQILAGVSVSIIESVMFCGIALAAFLFTIAVFKGIQENRELSPA